MMKKAQMDTLKPAAKKPEEDTKASDSKAPIKIGRASCRERVSSPV